MRLQNLAYFVLLTAIILLAVVLQISCNDSPVKVGSDYVSTGDYDGALSTTLSSPYMVLESEAEHEIILKWRETRVMSNPPQSGIGVGEPAYLMKYVPHFFAGASSHHRGAKALLGRGEDSTENLWWYLDYAQGAPCVALDINQEALVIDGYLLAGDLELAKKETRLRIKSVEYISFSSKDSPKFRLASAELKPVGRELKVSIESEKLDLRDYSYALIPAYPCCIELNHDEHDYSFYYVVDLKTIWAKRDWVL